MAGKQGLHLSPDRQAEEYRLCKDGLEGFIYWCENYARIEDKDTHKPVPFKLYACQRRIMKRVFQRKWLRILKARRLGVTWLFAAYAVWLMTFRKMYTVGYIIHKKEYSQDFIDNRCDFIVSRIPLWLRPVPTGQNKNELDFKDNESWIRAMAATRGAADSVAADLVVVDEATKIEEKQAGLLGGILQSIEPTVETAKGIIILIAKSEGPQGLFYKGWQASEKGNDKYQNEFLSWRMRPGRTPTWYANETRLHESDPLFMARNYPSTAEEAFQQAEGRVYAQFNTTTHVVRILPDGSMASETDHPLWVAGHWTKWRGIDFGGRNPFACIWLCRISKEGLRLTVDPACEKTIGEFLSYRYKPHTDYFENKNDHAVDAIRYMVETFNLQRGHYHIYRELYLPNSAGDGLEVPDLARMIVEMSGDETFSMTVADRSEPTSINSLQLNRIPCMPNMHYLKEGASRRSLIAQGVRMVRALLHGTAEFLPPRVRPEPSPEDRVTTPAPGVTVSLEDARLLRKKKERRASGAAVKARHRQMVRPRRFAGRPTFG